MCDGRGSGVKQEKLEMAQHKKLETVYIVTKGDYSDYRIVAVFKSRKEAEDFIGEDTEPNIEEWTCGEPKEGPNRKVWHVKMDLLSGNFLEKTYTYFTQKPRDWSEGYVNCSYNYHYATGASVISEEHAMKVAIEARQKWLARKT
jgi:hypothetical protein